MRKAINHLKASDPVMRRIIETVGAYKISYSEPDFETLVRSIVYQQLSGKAAATIYGRLENAVSRRGKIQPAAILKLGVEAMRPLGLSSQKAKYVTDLAEKTLSKDVRFSRLSELDDDQVVEHLTQVKGVGVWTVQMFLMFALRRNDVLPLGDLGIKNAMVKAYGLEAAPTPVEMEALAEPWRPYRTIGCWYLWRSLDGPAQL
jgi:DNA-3-methyladenine glycosylase II